MLVLIIDDDEVDYLSVKRVLNKAFSATEITITWVSNPENIDLMQELAKADVCIIDQNMGALSGIDIIRKVTDQGNITPMILLTGVDDQQIDRQASEYGASDYLIKDQLTPQLLNRVIRFSLAQKEHAKRLTKLAYTDGLTSLANRLKFDQSLTQGLSIANRTGTYLALMIIDLDNFKYINDNYGHDAGDQVLIGVSKRLVSLVRGSDIVARLGGDEFALIITCCYDRDDIEAVADKVVHSFHQTITYEHQQLSCYASIGVSVYDPTQPVPSLSAMIREADDALYQIKRKGKNACQFFNPKIREQLIKKLSIERELSQAINNNELYLHYQPKISVSDQKISGVEALLRWTNKKGENISPVVFIPIAERTKYILEIGRWVIEQSCLQLRQWLDRGIDVVPIAVNVSAVQLEELGFVQHIQKTLEKYSLTPALLELEITESSLMENYQQVMSAINSLADIGCQWSIDDFGTGYSSLSRLNELPITKIKIDRSFVEKIETSKSSKKICTTIISLAKALNLSVVVEGIENQQQLNSVPLSEHDELQGFFFSKPLAPDDFVKFLLKTERSSVIESPLPLVAVNT